MGAGSAFQVRHRELGVEIVFLPHRDVGKELNSKKILHVLDKYGTDDRRYRAC